MPDEIGSLAPHDPSAAHPGWADARSRILDDVLASEAGTGASAVGGRRGTSRRWLAGIAAAAVLAAGVGIATELRPGDGTTVAGPAPSVSGSVQVETAGVLTPEQREVARQVALTWLEHQGSDPADVGVAKATTITLGGIRSVEDAAALVDQTTEADDTPVLVVELNGPVGQSGTARPPAGTTMGEPDGVLLVATMDGRVLASASYLTDGSHSHDVVGGLLPGDDEVLDLTVETTPTPSSSPSTTTANVDPNSDPILWSTSGIIFDGEDGGQQLCVGIILESYPPQCGGQMLDLAGAVPGAEKTLDYAWVSIEGQWDPANNTFTVARNWVEGDPDVDATEPLGPELFPDLCADPIQGTLPLATDPANVPGDTITVAAANLPGYQGGWVSNDQSFANIAVGSDVEGAITKLTPLVSGRFCLGTIPGPTASEAQAAVERLSAAGFIGNTLLTYGVSSLSVPIAYQDDEQARRIREAVGEAVWPFTRIEFPIRRVGTEVELYTHCGINDLQVDGKWYQRDGGPIDDGNGNPPADWLNPTMPGSVIVTGDRATWTDAIGHYEFFTLRPGATAPLVMCS